MCNKRFDIEDLMFMGITYKIENSEIYQKSEKY